MRSNPTKTPSSAHAGFTLIEILVAMLVFLAGIAGLFALLSTGLTMQRDGLEISRSGRRVEEVAHMLQLELSAGRLRADVPAAMLAEGIWYRATFLGDGLGGPGAGRSALLPVELRVAATQKGLDKAAPFIHLLGTGPTMSQAVEAWRAKRMSETHTNSPSTLDSR